MSPWRITLWQRPKLSNKCPTLLGEWGTIGDKSWQIMANPILRIGIKLELKHFPLLSICLKLLRSLYNDHNLHTQIIC